MSVPVKTSYDINRADKFSCEGYHNVEKLAQHQRSSIYRARDIKSGETVIIKAMRSNDRHRDDLSLFHREAEIAGHLKGCRGIAQLVAARLYLERPLLIYRDSGGVPLQRVLLRADLTLAHKLGIAIKIANALSELHGRNLVHRNLNPANILYNDATSSIEIINFSFCGFVMKDRLPLKKARKWEGNALYFAPEQAHGIEKTVDYRSDLYVLGIIFYEMFTGKKPFSEDEPSKLIHCHVAKNAPSPVTANSALPGIIADVISKLIEKRAQERYQSARGLSADLQKCLHELLANAKIEAFALGRKDFPADFRLPEKLYGRVEQIGHLRAALSSIDSVSCDLVLVVGDAGVGKTVMVHDVLRPVARRGGYFVEGRFAPQNEAEPFSTLIDVVRGLLARVLCEDDNELDAWRDFFRQRLSGYCSIIKTYFPGSKDIWHECIMTAEQEPYSLAQLPMIETVIKEVILYAAGRGHPLYLFLDDMHLADGGSLRFIASLLTEQVNGKILWIGAVRPQEVGENRRLSTLLEDGKSGLGKVKVIELGTLAVDDVADLLCDIFRVAKEEVRPLAALVVEKSAGNPHNVNEFVQSIVHEGLVFFNPVLSRWQWHLTRIGQLSSMDSAVDLARAKMVLLSSATRGLLGVASVIGERFELALLARVVSMSIENILDLLRPALLQGVVSEVFDDMGSALTEDHPLNRRYGFIHHRIQEALFDSMPADLRAKYHTSIGEILVESFGSQSIEEGALTLKACDHLNLGIVGLIAPVRLAKFNFMAYAHAKNKGMESAGAYLLKAADLLVDPKTSDEIELFGKISIELMRMTFDMGQLEGARKYSQNLLNYEVSFPLKAFARAICAAVLIRSGDLVGGVQAASSLSCEITRRIMPPRGLWGLILNKKAALTLRRPRPLADAEVAGLLLVIKFMINTCHGVSEQVAEQLVACGSQLAQGKTKQPERDWFMVHRTILAAKKSREAARMVPMAKESYERLVGTLTPYYRSVYSLIYMAYVAHWERPIKAILEHLYNIARENVSGEVAWNAAINYFAYGLYTGVPLDHLIRKMWVLPQTSCKWEEVTPWFFSLRFYGHRPEGDELRKAGKLLSAPGQYAPTLSECHPIEWWIQCHISMIDAYIHREYDQAACYGDKVFARLEVIKASAHEPVFLFYYTLLLVQRVATAKGLRRIKMVKMMVGLMLQLRSWAKISPINHGHRYLLARAEIWRLVGWDSAATNLYEQAILASSQGDYLHEIAVACELAGRFSLERNRFTIGYSYIQKARNLYAEWGAKIKTNQLAEEFATVKESEALRYFESSDQMRNLQMADDLEGFKRALLSIASENTSMRMMEKLVQVSIEFTGAQRGVLLLCKDHKQFFVEVEAEVGKGTTPYYRGIAMHAYEALPQQVLNYVKRTKKALIINNTAQAIVEVNIPQSLLDDSYLVGAGVRSLLCYPIMMSSYDQGEQMVGILYLENKLVDGCFSEERIDLLKIICLLATGRMELSIKAATDGLTGLYNYQHFQNMLNREFAQSQRQMSQLSLLMIDIDFFKTFNDKWGHQAGDAILKEVAQVIQTQCRKSDIVARYGGEEMVVILPGTDNAGAVLLAERIRGGIESLAVAFDKNMLRVTASIGVATLGDNMRDKDALIKAADKALYISKDGGRNRVTAE